ncbi:MAG TPA: MerR family transcriptional regulator [Alphaproteobacteria bacterium]|nr:MerR family transcriptional regulator [Alphaproteobacteria bacterium]
MSLSEKQVVALIEELTVKHLRVWVQEGWIEPRIADEGPVYDEIDVARLRFVCQLKHEMNVNDDALPVILDLVDQLYGLRRTLRMVGHAIENQPQSTRDLIAKAIRESSGP